MCGIFRVELLLFFCKKNNCIKIRDNRFWNISTAFKKLHESTVCVGVKCTWVGTI
jgi:hypothetical protein